MGGRGCGGRRAGGRQRGARRAPRRRPRPRPAHGPPATTTTAPTTTVAGADGPDHHDRPSDHDVAGPATTEGDPTADDPDAAGAPAASPQTAPRPPTGSPSAGPRGRARRSSTGSALGVSVPGDRGPPSTCSWRCSASRAPSRPSSAAGTRTAGTKWSTARCTAPCRLDALLSVGRVDGLPPRPVDCRTEPCSIVGRATSRCGGALVDARHSPCRSTPRDRSPHRPPRRSTPAGPYVHGQAVTVQADGLVWAPTPPSSSGCRPGVDTAHCDQGPGERRSCSRTADAEELPCGVLAVIDSGGGPVDCRDAEACELVVISE